jgi:hypothetical protein
MRLVGSGDAILFDGRARIHHRSRVSFQFHVFYVNWMLFTAVRHPFEDGMAKSLSTVSTFPFLSVTSQRSPTTVVSGGRHAIGV